MKRIFLSFAILLASVLCSAESVSLTRAESVAKTFFGGSATKASDIKVKLVWDGGDAAVRSAEPAFYVFENEAGGWVIVSGEDAAAPVLGYSESGSFVTEKMPSQVSSWFDGYKRQVAYLRAKGIAADASAQQLWKNVSSIRNASGKKMLNTKKWGQDAPYYNLCPTVDNQHAVTGCVCTALCEVMCYHKWPEKGNGTLPSYSYTTDKNKKRTQPGHELTATYNWDAMPTSYTNYTSEQASNVAQLMFDVGVMIQSLYNGADGKSTYGTGAYCEDVIAAMVKYMDYDSSAVLLYRDDYSTLRWAEMLREEIYAGRPVVYGGMGADYAGHEFVIDGCDANDMFYVNWGWDGTDNGWFAITSLMIDKDYDFRYYQDGFFGIQKNKGGKSIASAVLYDENGNGGLSLASGSVASGSFTMSAGTVYNFGPFPSTYTFAYVLMDYADNVKGLLCQPETKELDSYEDAATKMSCSTELYASSLKFGDKIVFCTKAEDGSWQKVKIDSSCSGVDEYPLFEMPAIKVNGSATYSAADIIPLAIVNVRTRPSSAKWYIDGTLYNDTEVVLPAGKHTLKCVATFSDRVETLVQQIEVK